MYGIVICNKKTGSSMFYRFSTFDAASDFMKSVLDSDNYEDLAVHLTVIGEENDDESEDRGLPADYGDPYCGQREADDTGIDADGSDTDASYGKED